MAKKNNNQAVHVINELLEAFPNSGIGNYLNGLNQLSLGEKDDAKASFEKAYELIPGFLKNTVLLVRIELEDGNYERALLLAEQISNKAPDVPAGYVAKGDALMGLRKYRQALEAYDVAWNIKQSRDIVIKRFNATRKQYSNERSYKLMLDWLQQHPDDSAVHFVIANTYQADKQNSKAIQHYKKILEKQPEHVAVLNNLAWVYSEQGDPRALNIAERAYKLNPASPAIMDTYGWLLLKQGKAEQSLRLLQEAARALPGEPEVQYHMAAALYKTGEKVAARKVINQLLDSGVEFNGRADAQALVEGS